MMATPREYAQSVMARLLLVQEASDELLDTEGVVDILREMDNLADDLEEVLG